jgi:aspartyl protease family protein
MMPQLVTFIAANVVVQLALYSLLLVLAGNVLRRPLPFAAGTLRLVGNIGLVVGLALAGAHLLHVPTGFGPLADDPPQQTMTGTETRIRLADDGHFWVQARAHGTVQRMLIDTGATLTTLSAEAADAMGAVPDPDDNQVQMTTANGTTQARLGIIPSLRVGNVVVHHLPVAVSPGMVGTNVLGMNFLTQLASWRVEGHTMILVPLHPHAPSDIANPN